MYTRPLGILNLTGDGWEYFACPGAVYLTITVMNAPVDIQYGQGWGVKASAAQFPPSPSTLFPGTDKGPRQCDLIRIKAHSGSPQILVEALKPDDLPKGVELGASFTPSYAILNLDGTIGALFTGAVQLQTSAGSGPIAQNAVNWVTSGGAVIADILGESGQGITDLTLNSTINNALAQLALTSDRQISPHTLLSIIADDGIAPRQSRRLLASDGSSDFMQLLNTGTRKLTWGDWQLSTPGSWTNGQWQTITINHGWGTTPYAVWPIIVAGGGILTSIGIGATYNYSGTQFQMDLYNASGITLGASTIHIAGLALI